MASLIASYRLSATGYDAANTRLIDESGNGNHLSLLAGTPDFTGSYSGKTCFKMHGTAYFGGANLMHPECWTAISVLHPHLAGGETLNYLWSTSRVYPSTDPAHVTPTQPFEDGTSSSSQFTAQRAKIGDTYGVVGTDFFGTGAVSTGLVDNAWNVITDVWNGEASQVKKRFGTSAWGTGAINQHYQVGLIEEMRIGYRPTALTTTSNHLGALRVEIYSGDYTIDDPTGYAARVAALTANPDL